MDPKLASVALVGAVAGAAVVALFAVRSPSPPSPPAAPVGAAAPLPPAHPGLGMMGSALPPGHPPIGAGMGVPAPMGGPAAQADQPALRWKTPAGWQELPNPNAMRLATLRPPGAPGDADPAELTISRAGGTAEANIQRWLGQFDDAGQDTREQRTVQGLTVTVVEVKGTYLAAAGGSPSATRPQGGGPMMGGAPSAPRPGWMLRAAIVETPGFAYFFKLTGPAATVTAARAGFDALIDGLEPLK